MADAWFSFPRTAAPPPQIQTLIVETAPNPPSVNPPVPQRSPDIPRPGTTVVVETIPVTVTVMAPWYKTPLGMGAIAVAALAGGWYAFKKK